MNILARLAALLALVIVVAPRLPAAAAPRPEPVASAQPAPAPAAEPELTLANHAGGQLLEIHARAGRAFGIAGPSLLVFDIADADHPALIARLLLPAEIEDLALSGDYAYLALGAAGLAAVRISDPAAPALIARLEDGDHRGIAAQGGLLYAATADALRIYGTADPAAPARLGELAMRTDTWSRALRSLTVAAGHAYVPAQEDGYGTVVTIVNVANPARPVAVGRLSDYAYGEHMAIAGRYLYVAFSTCGGHRCSVPYSNLLVFDLSNPAAPVELSRTVREWHSATALAVSGQAGYLSGDPLDLRNPAAPVLLARPAGVDEIIAIEGGRGLARGAGLQIVDLAAPLQPAPRGRVEIGHPSNFVSRNGAHALSVDAYMRIHITDLAAQPPRVVAALTAAENEHAYEMASAGGVSYVATAVDVRIVDWRTPAAPATTVLTESVSALLIDGDRLYVARRAGPLAIYDIQDPVAPQHLQTINPGGRQVGLAKRGNLLYAMNHAGLLRIMDLSDPAAPLELSSIDLYDVQQPRLLLSGDYLFIAGQDPLYFITGRGVYYRLDVADPAAPAIEEYDWISPAAGLLAGDGNLVYRSKGALIEVLDVLAPEPARIATYQTRAGVEDGQLDGQRLLVAAGADGLYEFATPTMAVGGAVTNGYRAPVAGVTLEINGRTVASAADGTFALDGLPGVWATVTPRRSGLRFIPASRTVRAGDGAQTLSFEAVPVSSSVTVGAGATALVSLDAQGRATLLDLPAGAVPAGTTVTLSPTLVPAGGPELIAGHVFDLALSGGAAFARPVTLSVAYGPGDLRAISDPAALRLARWQDGAWTDAAAGCDAAPPAQAAGAARTTICQPGRYALLGPTNRVALPQLGR